MTFRVPTRRIHSKNGIWSTSRFLDTLWGSQPPLALAYEPRRPLLALHHGALIKHQSYLLGLLIADAPTSSARQGSSLTCGVRLLLILLCVLVQVDRLFEIRAQIRSQLENYNLKEIMLETSRCTDVALGQTSLSAQCNSKGRWHPHEKPPSAIGVLLSSTSMQVTGGKV